MKHTKLSLLALSILLMASASVIAEEGHGHAKEGSHTEKSGIIIDADKRAAAGITIEKIHLKFVADTIRVPGEVKINDYRSQVITPRIDSMVIERHVVLGDHVKVGQPLATLFSVEVAEAQGQYILGAKEWQRVKKLGKGVVSGKRYTEAEVGYQQSRARLQAYGMSEKEINLLLKADKKRNPGHFTLFSSQAGTITSDNFRAGELIEPGRTLFDVVDEDVLWIEAHVSTEHAEKINENDSAWVHLNGVSRKSIVRQKNHVLDETTRTLVVRLEVDNTDHSFAPGQFVDVEIASAASKEVLAVPSGAVLRSADGDWQIFTENETGNLVPIEIEVLRSAGDQKVIEGISAGTKVVTQGAFFVQSEIAKGGFDIHNH